MVLKLSIALKGCQINVHTIDFLYGQMGELEFFLGYIQARVGLYVEWIGD